MEGMFFFQIMVNNHLIIGDRLVSNKFPTDYASSARGGYIHKPSAQFSHIVATRVAVVYLTAGSHTFEIGVKTETNSAIIRRGTILFELEEYDTNANIGLPLYDSNGAVVLHNIG